MRINNEPISIAITLSGGSIAISENDRIIIGPDISSETSPRYDLGPATKDQFKAIISYFERLSIHGKD